MTLCYTLLSAQMAGLLCEEEGPEADNVKYCGYCKHHYNKMVQRKSSFLYLTYFSEKFVLFFVIVIF